MESLLQQLTGSSFIFVKKQNQKKPDNLALRPILAAGMTYFQYSDVKYNYFHFTSTFLRCNQTLF